MDIPEGNEEVFRLLYKLENGLRELIIEQLEAVEGPRWYKSRLPGAVLEKFKAGIAAERSISWSRLIPHHPLYYVDFAHLREIITNGKNWDSVFKSRFGRREVFEGNFTELESIRNRVAHNRKLSRADVEIARGIYRVFSEILGSEQIEILAHRCTAKEDILDEIAALRLEIGRVYQEIQLTRPLSPFLAWKHVSASWWFDDSYLVVTLDGSRMFYQLAEAYSSLPRNRGSGPNLEKWVRNSGIHAAFIRADAEMNILLSSQ